MPSKMSSGAMPHGQDPEYRALLPGIQGCPDTINLLAGRVVAAMAPRATAIGPVTNKFQPQKMHQLALHSG